jgi:toxin HigB-1
VSPEYAVKIVRGLARLDEATRGEHLDLPGFRLHPLRELAGYWSITARANWRIIFRFEEELRLTVSPGGNVSRFRWSRFRATTLSVLFIVDILIFIGHAADLFHLDNINGIVQRNLAVYSPILLIDAFKRAEKHCYSAKGFDGLQHGACDDWDGSDNVIEHLHNDHPSYSKERLKNLILLVCNNTRMITGAQIIILVPTPTALSLNKLPSFYMRCAHYGEMDHRS